MNRRATQTVGQRCGAAQPGQGSSMTPPNGVARQWPCSCRMRSCTAITNASVSQSGMVAPSDAANRRMPGDELARRDPLRAPVQRADDLLDRAHVSAAPSSPRPCGRSCRPASCRRPGCPRNPLLVVPRSRPHNAASRARGTAGLALHLLAPPRRALDDSRWRSSESFSNRTRMSAGSLPARRRFSAEDDAGRPLPKGFVACFPARRC